MQRATSTVFNTDSIRIRGDLGVRLGGGGFAPGATPEADGAPEVEIHFTGYLTSTRAATE
jgi:hypothetical protein